VKKKIVIIGGTGFIGFHLCKSCVAKGLYTERVSRKKPRFDRVIKGVKYTLCDISKKEEIKKKLSKDYDYVINLGGDVNQKTAFGMQYLILIKAELMFKVLLDSIQI